MSAPKHTPGPWKVVEMENAWSVYPAVDAPSLDGSIVMHTHKCIVNDHCGFEWRGTEHEANAILIAAAPEMLRVLKLVSGAIAPGCEATREAVERVIALAEGRQ